VFCRKDTILPSDLPFGRKGSTAQSQPPSPLDDGRVEPTFADLPYRDAKQRAVAAFEQAYFSSVLRRAGGNVSEAARQSGLDRSNFRRAARRAGVGSR
jgi:DNA-binding NtrC family response regulator